MSEPDDTPTRQQQHVEDYRASRLHNIQHRLKQHPYDGPFDLDDARWLVAEVSRLREALEQAQQLRSADTVLIGDLQETVARLQHEMAPLYNTEQWLKWCDIRVLERAEAAEADVSRLQQENALLKRSLAMLCQQAD